MDKFVALLIAFFAFAFLWMYDTGRWNDISPILFGTQRTGTQPASLTYANYISGNQQDQNQLPGNQPKPKPGGGGLGGTLGDISNTACAIIPGACVYDSLIDNVVNFFDRIF